MSAPLRFAFAFAGLIALGLARIDAHAGERERAVAPDPDDLVNTGGWALVSATGAGSEGVRIAGADFVLAFEHHAVNVTGPCNRMRGDYSVSGKRMTVTVATTTRMACEDARNAADQRFVALFSGKFHAEVVVIGDGPERLRLVADDGRALEFEAKPMQF